MTLSRRIFLRNGVVTLAAVGGATCVEPGFLRRAAIAAAGEPKTGGRKVLVCVFQRGACDGLSMIAPYGDRHYHELRKEIAIPAPKPGDRDAGLDLDGFFALHPRLDTLLPIWKRGDLAVVHACGSPNASRSHFDMQDYMEAGVADDKSIASGWANRALAAKQAEGPSGRRERPSPFRAVSMTTATPRTLAGDVPALAIRELASFGIRGGAAAGPATGTPSATGFEAMYEGAVNDPVGGAGKESFDAIAMLKQADPTRYRPAKGVTYPGTGLGRGLLAVAQLVKSGLGVEVAFVEDDGWDTHANQGNSNGQIAGKFLDLGRALAAFDRDLGDRMADVTVLTMTEFGRAVRQNGVRGTDHGHASSFLAFGGGVAGGKVYGDWPTLAPEELFEGRDLAVTTDYRDVFAEVCVKHLGVPAGALAKIFPKHQADPANFRGFVRT